MRKILDSINEFKSVSWIKLFNTFCLLTCPNKLPSGRCNKLDNWQRTTRWLSSMTVLKKRLVGSKASRSMMSSKNLSQYLTLSGSTGPAKNIHIVRVRLFYIFNVITLISKVYRKRFFYINFKWNSIFCIRHKDTYLLQELSPILSWILSWAYARTSFPTQVSPFALDYPSFL